MGWWTGGDRSSWTRQRARHRYREDEIERIRRGMAGFAGCVERYTDGELRIDWSMRVLEEPLTRLDGEGSFWPGPDACMPRLGEVRSGDADTLMVFVKVSGDAARGETEPTVPQMLLGGALGALGELTRHATYIGFNWGSGTAADEPDGEPMLHEWPHSAQWALEDYQAYPRGLMFTSDGGRMMGEEGGDLCYRRTAAETSWMRFYEHLMRGHVTRRMWRGLSITRRPANVWMDSYCRDFRVLGPFAAAGKPAMGLDEPFIDETRRGVRLGEEGGSMVWRAVHTAGFRLDLNQALGARDEHVAYLAADVHSEVEQSAWLRVGSDDGCKVWHNGRLVVEAREARGAEPDQDVARVTLTAGDNCLLMKVANVGGGWEAMMRLTDRQGGPVSGLTWR